MNPFEDMRLFCQVMESGSFTAAAEQLGLSKQFVSRRLIQLEDRLGVRLLNRSTRRLDVTPLGQSYYESALRLLAEVEQVEQGIAAPFASVRPCRSPWRTWVACCRCSCASIRRSALKST